ncbi:Na/Pi cotransporter family protein [Verrucomicrobiota bacterium]
MDAPSDVVTGLFWVLGGLALFLYGIEMMGKALRKAAGSTLRNGLERLTRTRFHGLVTGTVVTGLLQSSSATTVMVVGFINAGLLVFGRSIGLILGANIGTTVTPQITAFDLDTWALPLLGIGFLLNFLPRKRVVRQLGAACMGFGMLFFGLTLMKLAVSGYQDGIRGWLTLFTEGGLAAQVFAFLTAAIVTTIIQSSAATVVMMQALAIQGALTDIRIAIPMILGADIGTCITAMLASLRASRSARRAAVAHLVFNLIGALITAAAFRFYVWFIPLTARGLGRQIANGHLAIKLVNACLFLPFTNLFARLITRLVPGEDKLNAAPLFLDHRAVTEPPRALDNAAREIHRICRVCVEIVRDAVEAFLSGDEMAQEIVLKREELVDDLYSSVAEYVAATSRHEIPTPLSSRPAQLLHIMSDVERIGDHAENIVEISRAYSRRETRLSEPAADEIRRLNESIAGLGKLVLAALERPEDRLLPEILSARERINDEADEIMKSHEERLQEGGSSPTAELVFVDLTTNMRRVANHLRNAGVSALAGVPGGGALARLV